MKPAGMAQAAALAPIRENRVRAPLSALVQASSLGVADDELQLSTNVPVREFPVTLPIQQDLLNPASNLVGFTQALTEAFARMSPRDDERVNTMLPITPPIFPGTPLVTEPLPMFPETYADLLQVWPIIPMPPTLPATPEEMPPTLPATPVDMPVTLPATPVGDAPRTPEVYRMKRAGPIEAGETNAPKRPCMIDKSFAGGESDSDGELNLMDEI
jgi:hypothetical protein